MMLALVPTPRQLFTAQFMAAKKSWQQAENLLPDIEALEKAFWTELQDARERSVMYAELSSQQYRLAASHFRRGRRHKGLAKIARCKSFARMARQARRERRAWGRRLYELCQMRHVINVRRERYNRLLEAAGGLLPAFGDRGFAAIA